MESDTELIKSAQRGDPAAFETLYRRYRDWVYRLAWRFTRDRDLALDVLQETFTYLVKKLPRLELTASMTSFLYPVVKHVSITARKKKARLISSDEVVAQIPAPVSRQADSSRAELAEVLAGLADEQREILLMRFVDDMTLDEIAAGLDLAPSTVKSRLYRALEKLRHDGRTRRYFLE
ncbi:MAG: RNA polymerase sigma factor [Planctomycetota bacterium]|jgi:RNA polymerase sigma-70 factor (ECF subfamily)